MWTMILGYRHLDSPLKNLSGGGEIPFGCVILSQTKHYWAHSSTVEQFPFKELVQSSNLCGLTRRDENSLL